MTTDQPREWRDEQGLSLTDLENGDFAMNGPGLPTKVLPGRMARFLLRVLPEALGLPLNMVNGGETLARLERLSERIMARDEEAAKLDRAIVEAAERCCAAYRNDAVFSIDDFNEAARELLRAVEAKRSATSSPQAERSGRTPKP